MRKITVVFIMSSVMAIGMAHMASAVTVLNNSFESPDISPDPGWSDNDIADWQGSSSDTTEWGCGASGILGLFPVTPYGDQWSYLNAAGTHSTTENGRIWQKIGTVANDTFYNISFLQSDQGNLPSSALRVSIWAGSDTEPLVLLDDKLFAPVTPRGNGSKEVVERDATLLTGNEHDGEALYLMFEADNAGSPGAVYVDYVEMVLTSPPLPLTGSFGSVDHRYPREMEPGAGGATTWSGTGWRGERLYAQIPLWSETGAYLVSCSGSPLSDGHGREIAASCVKPQFVRYVLADDGANGCASNSDRPTTWQPDVIDTVELLDEIPAHTAQPVWVSIDVPNDATPGVYQGQITIAAQEMADLTFDIELEVLRLTLPEPSEWEFHLDLWQNPWAVARYHNVQPWSQEHWDLLVPIFTMLAQAGQKCITTTIQWHPLGDQTLDPYETMVEWTKHTDGTWSYDYTLFDQYVEFCDSIGISKQISCYSMVPWGYRMRYFDEADGVYITVTEVTPGTTAYNDFWIPFLQDFKAHLIAKGWLARTAIAMDEKPTAEIQAAIDLVNTYAPKLKITFAGNYYSAVEPEIDDMCTIITGTSSITESLIAARTQQGRETTIYVCCGPSAPNTFTYSPPAESAWLGWHTAKRKFTGLLRWAYNSWPQEPLVDTRYTKWPAGDTFLVYPGPRSSIRFERLREGIQDYEKIRILRGTLLGTDLQDLEDMLDNGFTYPQAVPYADPVNVGKAELLRLSRIVVAYSAFENWDLTDFAVLSEYWLENDCGVCGGADLTGEGYVGMADLQIFVENWLNQ